MTAKDTHFLAEMYSLVKKMEATIEEFDMRERILASIVVGVLDSDALEDEAETAELKTMYSFNLESREELETIKSLMDDMYTDEEPLDDLLNGLGISLN